MERDCPHCHSKMREGWTLEGTQVWEHGRLCGGKRQEEKGPGAHLHRASDDGAFAISWKAHRTEGPLEINFKKQREVVVSIASSEEKHSE